MSSVEEVTQLDIHGASPRTPGFDEAYLRHVQTNTPAYLVPDTVGLHPITPDDRAAMENRSGAKTNAALSTGLGLVATRTIRPDAISRARPQNQLPHNE